MTRDEYKELCDKILNPATVILGAQSIDVTDEFRRDMIERSVNKIVLYIKDLENRLPKKGDTHEG